MSLKFDGPRYEYHRSSTGNLSVVDIVQPDVLFLIDNYWYQFPPLNPLWHGILSFVMVILATCSLSGNFIVIYIFTTTKSLRTPSNLYVVNLALSDFLMMFTMAPPMLINCYHETWTFGPLMCQIYGMCGSLFGCTAIWSMVLIANDRYNVIVKGLAGKPLTITTAILKIFGIWVFNFLWTIAPVFGWNRYVPEGNMTACGTDYLSKDWLSRSYIVAYSVFVYFIPLFTIIYSYYYIIQAVAAHEKNMREQAKKMNVASLRSTDDKNKSAEIKLAKIALVTISLWFVAWTPYLIINWFGIFEIASLSPLNTIWGSVFAKANSIYNPIIYGISHPKYQTALYEKIPCLACGPSPGAQQAPSETNQSIATSEEIKPTTN